MFGSTHYLDNRIDLRSILLPYWLPFILFAILPMTRAISILRTRRGNLAGHCLHCGYDLRATPERCPECGSFATESQRAQRQQT
jgi:hypothetical protein